MRREQVGMWNRTATRSPWRLIMPAKPLNVDWPTNSLLLLFYPVPCLTAGTKPIFFQKQDGREPELLCAVTAAWDNRSHWLPIPHALQACQIKSRRCEKTSRSQCIHSFIIIHSFCTVRTEFGGLMGNGINTPGKSPRLAEKLQRTEQIMFELARNGSQAQGDAFVTLVLCPCSLCFATAPRSTNEDSILYSPLSITSAKHRSVHSSRTRRLQKAKKEQR